MISKERLEELIEQGATIWSDIYEEIKLDKNTCEIWEVRSLDGKHWGWILCFLYDKNQNLWEEVDIEDLEEDVDKSRWNYEFGCIERVERLKLPTWEEIKHEFIDKNYLMNCDYTIIDIPDLILDIRVDIIPQIFIYSMEEKYNWNLTKENYTLACRKAKELFLGEKEDE